MKILNISMRACFTDGYSYQDNLLPEYQHKLGHEVTVLTSTNTRGENGIASSVREGTSFLKNGVKLIRIKIGGKFQQVLGIYPQVSSIIKSETPDLIFIHGLPSFVPAQAIKYMMKCNPATILVADNHQDERNAKVVGFPFSLLMFMWRLCWKQWFPFFAHIYGVTSWRTDFAHRYYGIPQDKLSTLIMGVDNRILPSDVSSVRSEIRKELGIEESAFVFVSGGKLNARKHTLDVMKAFMQCSVPNIRLLLFGSVASDIRSTFESFLRQDSRIHYIGFVASREVYKLFIASDFGLFPASHSVLWEEAAGCGLPCLFPRYSDHDHLQVCGNCVQLPPNASFESIHNVINRVVMDKSYYNELLENAHKAAPTFYYDNIAKKSVEI